MEAFAYGDILHPLNQVALEHENVREALNWGLERDDAPEAVALSESMFLYWDNRSYTDEAIYYLGLALEHIPKSGLWANLNMRLCRFLSKTGLHQRVERIIQDVLQFAEANEQGVIQLRALKAYTSILYDQSRYKEIVVVAEKYIALSRTMRQRKHLAQAFSILASAQGSLGNYQAEEVALAQAIMLGRESEDDILVARLTYNLAIAYVWHQNRPQEAISLLEESLGLKRLIGDRGGELSRLTFLGRLAAANGRFAQAETYLAEAMVIAQEINRAACSMFMLATPFFTKCRRCGQRPCAPQKKHSEWVVSIITHMILSVPTGR